MLIVQVCVGSACHLKGSAEIVSLLESAIAEHHLEDEVVLTGSFCIGKCNRTGVTVQVNDEVHIGVTTENFREFFKKNVLDAVEGERK
ncbi:MAG: NAD(P)H-dependent oxidoreductase subunit E [Clostridia bacterium]|nr:NAD(P)H-dependent oxidoreductase subunit E [Clostridia bacterium]MBQ7407603.1 NAD(P)H-dependent oxidoreductase subunit E [Clostridia bacterium]MBQ8268727.1 NAD(P)H-dependent oxidoreductase subunit E [Clostridia bacterium]MBR2325637.1 NAD(P)H-dependent oxidoreductase subunit E [Clostridia bacterium]